jgi:hypothetical protein
VLVEDVERELRNWALWRLAGGWAYQRGSHVVVDYSPVATRYKESTVPVLGGAATDVDDIVQGLEGTQRAALYAHYLGVSQRGRRIPATFRVFQVARELGYAERTYQRYLEQGRKAVGDRLSERRRRTAALRSSGEP